jgi:hypothetical protein
VVSGRAQNEAGIWIRSLARPGMALLVLRPRFPCVGAS